MIDPLVSLLDDERIAVHEAFWKGDSAASSTPMLPRARPGARVLGVPIAAACVQSGARRRAGVQRRAGHRGVALRPGPVRRFHQLARSARQPRLDDLLIAASVLFVVMTIRKRGLFPRPATV